MRTISAWLVVGVGLVGLTIGYMSGGSSTPVAGVAIPVIFGLMATVFAVLQAKKDRSDASTLPEPAPPADDHRSESGKTAALPDLHPHRNVGVCLVVFSLGFLAGAHTGAYVRVHELMRPRPSAPMLPWKEGDDQPPSVESALQWVAVQRELVSLGFDERQIDSFYRIQVKEWANRAAIGAWVNSPSLLIPWKGESPAGPLVPFRKSDKGWPFAFTFCQKVNGSVAPDCHSPIDKDLLGSHLKSPGPFFDWQIRAW
ncbi:hypothetical protein [Achromobacter sp.]|uniref:hypothetical protein n=1 Tax=Achromobacter sp. TaxID=134375 RepID=UPI0028A6EED9|nr:hypothetical protein [Achromobacter sp.]